ncbi:MAG: hypothetical protein L3J82_07375 [Planctomycetes bacterium]|nr:hypothetical protein [Planctomycetota bacterium]
MKYLAMILAVAVFALPMMAQDAAEGSEKTPAANEKPAEAEKPKKPELTDAGKKLLVDFKRVYSKYYEILLKRIKDGQEYDSNDVWDTAIKEAKNTEYKDRTEFFDAIRKMKKKDRLFKKTSSSLINKYAKDHAAAVKEINKE